MSVNKLISKLTKKGLTIAFAESMTGGSLAYEVIKIPGASKVITGSIIAYSNDQKINLLRIKKEDLLKYSVISEEIAVQMATHVREIISSDIGIGITGNAGPSFQEKTLYHEAWIAIDYKGKINTYHLEFGDMSRLESIRLTRHFTFEKLDQGLS